ncbi:DNA-directed RNA polymerase subunit delta [Seinonella peptonophila]|nr:DNA-directed RNA polymerase subunit delta [Seinonella peptonophila]
MSDNMTAEKQRETAMVDLTYQLLHEKGEPMTYQDIMQSVAAIKNFRKEDVARYIAQLYTEVNIDGRFVCVGRGLWGLKHWYPLDQTTDSAVAASMKDDYLDDEELEDEETEGDELEIDPSGEGD